MKVFKAWLQKLTDSEFQQHSRDYQFKLKQGRRLGYLRKKDTH